MPNLAGESSGYGDEDQQEIDTIGGDEDDGLSNYDVESEDQVCSVPHTTPAATFTVVESTLSDSPLPASCDAVCFSFIFLTVGGARWRGQRG